MAIRIHITDRDKKVLKFVEEYGSVTISQTRRMFYNTQKYGYDIARRRLRKLVDHRKLRVSRNSSGNENVYYMDKKISYHDLLVLDYYAELIYNGAQIVYFKPQKRWLDGKYISDAYCCYIIGDRVFFNIVEVVRTHEVDKDKYNELYKSQEPQKFSSMIYEKLGGNTIEKFPRLIVIDSVTYQKPIYINDNIKTHQLELDLKGFAKIFV